MLATEFNIIYTCKPNLYLYIICKSNLPKLTEINVNGINLLRGKYVSMLLLCLRKVKSDIEAPDRK